MGKPKIILSDNLIPVNIFEKCLETGLSRSEISKKFPKRENGAYYLDKFLNNLKESGLDFKKYLMKYFDFNWPKCRYSFLDLNFKITGKGLLFNDRHKSVPVNKKNSKKFLQACEEASKNRKGEQNPMFGKTPWNKGKSLEDPIIALIASKNRGRKHSEETRKKLSEAFKRHPKKSRHTTKHSEETKLILRKKTAQRWSEGKFNKVTSIHLKMRNFLESLMIDFVEEHQIVYYCVDFAFLSHKVAIECQGQFFHVDPRFYPNGPENAIQRRNYGRDKAKRSFCSKKGWTIIEVWEKEINDGSFKDFLKCKLLELKILG